MKVHPNDEQDLASLDPRNIRLYLQKQGWQRQAESSVSPDVWTLPTENGTYEIIAPSSQETRDFAKRVTELLRTLAIAEHRSERDVRRELTTAAFDVQYIRTHFSSPPGTALLRDAVGAFTAAQAMLSASTASLEQPSLVLPPRRPRRTRDLMQRVLAGPTSAGSYVISILVPVPPRRTLDEDSVGVDNETEPFERAATKHLHQVLVAARAAAIETQDTHTGFDAFLDRGTSGISANLCEALVDLAGKAAVGFDVHFAWSLYRPVYGLEPTVSFDDYTIPILRQAARELRNTPTESEVTIRGSVVRLHRERQFGSGQVTIAGFVDGDPPEKRRRVSLVLEESDYELAIRAHHNSTNVEVIGSLVQRGTRTHLKNVRHFFVWP